MKGADARFARHRTMHCEFDTPAFEPSETYHPYGAVLEKLTPDGNMLQFHYVGETYEMKAGKLR